jgi:hypothetical protein
MMQTTKGKLDKKKRAIRQFNFTDLYMPFLKLHDVKISHIFVMLRNLYIENQINIFMPDL